MAHPDRPAPPPGAPPPGTPPPSDPGSIADWSPPPWTAGLDAPAGWSLYAADTRPLWRRIPADWLEIAGALVLVGAVVGWYFIGVNTTTAGAPNATVTVTQSADASRSATGESDLSGNPHDYKLQRRRPARRGSGPAGETQQDPHEHQPHEHQPHEQHRDAEDDPISFGGSGPNRANVRNTATITAAKITRPEWARPPTIASRASWLRSQCSFHL